MVEKHGSQILVNKSTSNQRRHVNHRLVTLSKKRRISYRRIIFILNVFAGVVLQLAIAFGITCLFTQVAIYFVLEILWVFIRNVSRTLPWNIIYLLIMALMSSIIIGTECIEYNDDVPLFVFAFIWTMMQVVVSFAIFIMNDFTQTFLARIMNVIYTMVMVLGQIAYFARNQNTIFLLIAGVIGFTCTCYQLVKEMKWLFGEGEYSYPLDNIVLPAWNIYSYTWSLYLTVIWVYAPFGLRHKIP